MTYLLWWQHYLLRRNIKNRNTFYTLVTLQTDNAILYYIMSSLFDDITPKKDFMQDDKPINDKHSILDVAPVATRERDVRRTRRSERRMMPPTTKRKPASRNGNIIMWGIAISALIIALILVSFIFIQKATITIIPKTEAVDTASNIVFTAYQKAKPGELDYNVISKTIQASQSIPTTGSEQVNEKASGKIRIYNDYSTSPLRLIKNTRFESTNGNIYRIRTSIIIPGKGKDGTKGSLDALVYADSAGQSKNISGKGVKFTIPGLKGDPRYKGFYAISITPIVGGFSGTRAVVNQATLKTTQVTLRKQLEASAFAKISEQLKKGEVLFKGSLFTEFESLPVVYNKSGEATVREKMQIDAPIFTNTKVARVLTSSFDTTLSDGIISIDTPKNLTMSILNKETVAIKTDSLIQFTLSGKTNVTWQIDVVNLKKDLLGKQSSMLNTIMSGYPGIKDGKATIRPFWRKTFPKQPDRIEIKIKNSSI